MNIASTPMGNEERDVLMTEVESQYFAASFKKKKIWPCYDYIKSSPLSAAYMRRWTGSALVQVMACHLFGAKPLPWPILTYSQFDP